MVKPLSRVRTWEDTHDTWEESLLGVLETSPKLSMRFSPEGKRELHWIQLRPSLRTASSSRAVLLRQEKMFAFG